MRVKANLMIRLPVNEDFDDLRLIFLQARQSTFTWADVNAFHLEDFGKETYGEKILVAVVDEIVAGFISIWEYDHFIHHLYVSESFQGKGIGSALLEAVAREVGFPLRLKCLEQNKKALIFYQKKGFVAKGKGLAELGVYLRLEKARPEY